jgi:ribosome-binding protein aMBF1 (putative translation factor)
MKELERIGNYKGADIETVEEFQRRINEASEDAGWSG